MSKILDKLFSPNFWVAIASLAAIVGVALVLVGFLTTKDGLIRIGMWLFAPLCFGAVLLVLVVTPFLLWANRKHKMD
jgi:hypothetical protein